MRKLFGTDGIRGVAGKDPITPELFLRLGKAVGFILLQNFGSDAAGTHDSWGPPPRLVVGRDTRDHGAFLTAALSAGLAYMGVEVLDAGVLPTPAIAYLIKAEGAQAGAVISASHNPYPDNGIKFFDHLGFKLPDAKELEIEKLLENSNLEKKRVDTELFGSVKILRQAASLYLSFLQKTIPAKTNISSMKLVVDCAQGATYRVAPAIFRRWGAKVKVLHGLPTGTNINEGSGSTHPQTLQEEVKRCRADVGFAFDGDGDRVMVVDESGEIRDGDYLLALFARRLKVQGKLPRKKIVGTVMSNLGLVKSLEAEGLELIQAPVGDRYVLEEMQKHKSPLGGEQSGHLIFLEHSTSGDGILTALQLLTLMKQEKKKLSVLCRCMQKYPQVLINVKVREKKDLNSIPAVMADIKKAQAALGKDGRVLVRYSGT
jgi:phosphoglucosamine mutase